MLDEWMDMDMDIDIDTSYENGQVGIFRVRRLGVISEVAFLYLTLYFEDLSGMDSWVGG